MFLPALLKWKPYFLMMLQIDLLLPGWQYLVSPADLLLERTQNDWEATADLSLV